MPISIISEQITKYIGGYNLFTNLENDGQYNFYTSMLADLMPFLQALRQGSQFLPWYFCSYYMIARVKEFDPLIISKLEGYPGRYDFGYLRYIQSGTRVVGPAMRLDTTDFCENNIHSISVSDLEPIFPFPDPLAFNTTTFTHVYPWLHDDLRRTASGQIPPATNFAYYFNQGVVVDVAFVWLANPFTTPASGNPLGIFLAQT